MRQPSALLALLALALLSGCLGDEASTGDTDLLPSEDTVEAAPPEPLHWEEDVLVGADPFNVVPVVTPVGGGTPCSSQASACFVYDFTTNTTVDLVATLAWRISANDFDLYLYQGDTQLSSDGINQLGSTEVPTPEQVLNHAGLTPGTYSFWVVAWNAVSDGFLLDVEFTAA